MEQTIKIKATISGMTCDSCKVHVDAAIKNIAGIRDVQIDNWQAGNAEIVALPEVSNADIESAIAQVGYRAKIISKTTSRQNHSTNERFNFDLIIVGGGSAAFAAAIKASELEKSVLMINDGLPIGGTCVNVGCVPSKTLIRTAEAFHNTRQTNFDGIETGTSHLDFKTVIRQKRELVTNLRQKKYVNVISDDPNVTVLKGRAKLLDQNTVQVNGKKRTAQVILLATGSSTFVPDIPGLRESFYYTNDTLYELEELPEHLIVLGGRYIALENGQLFARLGSKVTVLQRSPRILPTEQADVTDQLTEYLTAEGVDVKTGVKIFSVENNGAVNVRIKTGDREETVRGTHLFVATGRKGNTEKLGMENVGIETFGNGFIKTDDYLRTNAPNVFAAGDVVGENLFVYSAAYEGALAVENAFSETLRLKEETPLPWVVFTDPQVAGVGKDEAGAEAAGIEFDVSVLQLSDVPRALAARNTKGFIKLIRNKTDDTLVGARILASEGSEMLMEVALAIKYKIPVRELRQMLHPYLTLSEGIKLAAITFDKDVAKLSCCAV
ncbi:MAG: mercury(II) reductase [Actinobacteria bacterium]|nr:mercury(II) reductase [Actinomycetota bacterium]